MMKYRKPLKVLESRDGKVRKQGKYGGMATNILVLHGPNLNLLGEREPEIYGSQSLKEVNTLIKRESVSLHVKLKIYQSNSEGGLIDILQQHRKWANGVVFNPGAYSHYSYALRDAVSSISKPTVEVHFSNLKVREKFRRTSVIAPVCIDQISGLGWRSYIEGIKLLCTRISVGDAGKKSGWKLIKSAL